MSALRIEQIKAKKAKIKESQSYSISKEDYLTEKEEADLLKTLRKYPCRDTLLLEILLKTGARATEALMIEPEDLNHVTKEVRIVGLKGSNTRDIKLNDDLFNRLAEQCKHGLPFPIGYKRLQEIWYTYRPVKKKLHVLRHGAAIRTYLQTRDLLVVKALLGHKNINSTMVYAQHLERMEQLEKVRV